MVSIWLEREVKLSHTATAEINKASSSMFTSTILLYVVGRMAAGPTESGKSQLVTDLHIRPKGAHTIVMQSQKSAQGSSKQIQAWL